MESDEKRKKDQILHFDELNRFLFLPLHYIHINSIFLCSFHFNFLFLIFLCFLEVHLFFSKFYFFEFSQKSSNISTLFDRKSVLVGVETQKSQKKKRASFRAFKKLRFAKMAFVPQSASRERPAYIRITQKLKKPKVQIFSFNTQQPQIDPKIPSKVL